MKGILGDVNPMVLSSISPKMCLLFTVISMIPAFIISFKRPCHLTMISGVVYSSLCAFVFGYHVHEKALLIPLVIQTLLIYSRSTATARTKDHNDSNTNGNDNAKRKMDIRIGNNNYIPAPLYLFFILSTTGTFCLFPLFTKSRELYIKIFLFFIYTLFVCMLMYNTNNTTSSLVRIFPSFDYEIKHVNNNNNNNHYRIYQVSPLYILIVYFFLLLYTEAFHGKLQEHYNVHLEFFPLLLTSSVCSVFVLYSFILAMEQQLLLIY